MGEAIANETPFGRHWAGRWTALSGFFRIRNRPTTLEEVRKLVSEPPEFDRHILASELIEETAPELEPLNQQNRLHDYTPQRVLLRPILLVRDYDSIFVNLMRDRLLPD